MEAKVAVYDEDGITKTRTLEPVVFELNGTEHLIDAGFVSDGMSVLRAFWGIISPQVYGTTLKPSIIHDWLYAVKVCTRKQADDYFYDCLVANGFPKLKAWLVWVVSFKQHQSE